MPRFILDYLQSFLRSATRVCPGLRGFYSLREYRFTRHANRSIRQATSARHANCSSFSAVHRVTCIMRSPFSATRVYMGVYIHVCMYTSVCRVSSENYASPSSRRQLTRIASGRISAHRSAALQLQRQRSEIELTAVRDRILFSIKTQPARRPACCFVTLLTNSWQIS